MAPAVPTLRDTSGFAEMKPFTVQSLTAKGALIVVCLVPVPEISLNGVVAAVSRFALRRMG